MRCRRCGKRADHDRGEFLCTMAVTVNDINQVARVLLCGDCRVLVRARIEDALKPVGEAAGL